MKRLEQLPEITRHALAGITADEQLKYRILNAAREARAPRRRPRVWVAAACAAALLAAVILPLALRSPQPELITAMSAGETPVPTELSARSGIHSGALEAYGASLWGDGLIGLDGRYYRALPGQTDGSLAGESLGKIREFTSEPALSGSGSAVSNLCPVGTEVFAVRGMAGAAATAQVNGAWRVFQRVSFNGAGRVGRETLADTLGIRGRVVSMTLSGTGTVSGAQAASLANTLLSSAAYEGSGQLSGAGTLSITLDNGLTLQMMAASDRVSACGVWVCPEFFESFAQAVQ